MTGAPLLSRVRTRASSRALLAFALVLAPGAARADKTDKGMAEALFRAGKELSAAGKIAEACPKFAESHRLDPKPGTILNLATCHEQEGRTATAWAEYAEAATFAQRAKQAEREKFARGKVDELEKKLSYVVFKFPEDVEVAVDGKTLRSASAGTRIPFDPGDHPVSATAEGKEAWTGTLTVPVGPTERTFAIPTLAEAAVATPPAPAPAPLAAEAPESRGTTQRVLGWVSVGAGAVGLGFGAFFGAKTFSEKANVDDNCVGAQCNQSGVDANERAHDHATLSTIGFIAGGVLVVTGIVLLVTAPSTSRSVVNAHGNGGVFSTTW